MSNIKSIGNRKVEDQTLRGEGVPHLNLVKIPKR